MSMKKRRKILYFYHFNLNTAKEALISPYNATHRVYYADTKKELFFNSFSRAVKHLLDEGYIMENLFRVEE